MSQPQLGQNSAQHPPCGAGVSRRRSAAQTDTALPLVLTEFFFSICQRLQPTTASCRSSQLFCPPSFSSWNGVKTTTRKFMFPPQCLWRLSLVLICTLRVFSDVSPEALLAQLHTLDNHSALHILHSLTPLAKYEERKILDLLQQLPSSPGAGGPSPSCHLFVSVRMSDSISFFPSPPPPPGEIEAVVAPSPAARRNIVLFQGFCAIKYAVYALCVNARHSFSCSGSESKQSLQNCDKTDAEESQMAASSEGTKQ